MDSIIAANKQAEQTMWYLTVIAEQTREAIIVADFSGAIQFVNTAWATMHGYENSQELIGKQINVFHTKEQMKTDVIPFIEEVKHRGRLAGPLEHVRRNGTPFPTEMLMILLKDRMGKALGLIGFATDITEQERTEEELRRYRCHMEEFIRQRTEELEAANSKLQSQVTEHEQADRKLMQQTTELSAANELLREQIAEQERAKDEFEEQRDKLEQRLKQQSEELTSVEAQLQDEINKRKKQEKLIRQRTEELEAANSSLQSQVTEHEQADRKLMQQTAELSAANEQLQEQIVEQERAKDEFEEHRDKLEQRLKQQSEELTTVEAQLQDEINKRKKQEKLIRQRTEELEAANSSLQSQVTEHDQAGHKLIQQTAELSAANERLREQIVEQERVKGELEEHRDNLEQRLKQQTDELTAVEAQFQDEIANRKKEGEYSRQQSHTIKAVCERLRTQIGELSTRRPVGESDVCKTIAPLETAVSLSNVEDILEHVFRENIALQKPELVNSAVGSDISEGI